MVAALAADFTVRRGDFTLVLSLVAAPGEVVGLLGPNGAGKSTALRALAGLLRIDSGSIRLGDRLLAGDGAGVHLPPHQRPIGVVFQDYLLFPHLSVLDNVAFGARSRGMSRAQARSLARMWLARVDAADLAALRPGRISGGEAQRVALARALATEPDLLIMDEPLAALDARTRLLVRSELRRSLSGFRGAAVVVTHDPIDAIVLADRLVVLEAGRVVQAGMPAEVTRRPATEYVARLVGLNLLTGDADGHEIRLASGGVVHTATSANGPCAAAFRPASVALFASRPVGSPRNNWEGRVVGLEPSGDGVRVEIRGAPDEDSQLVAEVTPMAVAELDLRPGSPVWASVKASEIEVYPTKT